MANKVSRAVLVFCLIASLVIFSSLEITASQNNANTDWFKDAKYGVFVHYLNGIQNSASNVLSQGQATSWDTAVNAFNVTTFADQMAQAGVGYVIFTMQQSDKFMIAPNSKYNTYTGYATGQACSTRDLPNDLYTALNAKGIKLMLYWTGDGPHNDTQAAAGLGWDGTANDVYISRWGEVAKEYADRYGSKIAGWWNDGCYSGFGYNDVKINSLSYYEKSGNANSILSFNQGVIPIGSSNYLTDDYTPGERNSFDQTCSGRWINGYQWHTLSYLGTGWAKIGCRYSVQDMINYVSSVTANQGVVTMDVALYRDGTIDSMQLNQLKALKGAIKNGQMFNVVSNNKTATASSVYDSNVVASKGNDNNTATIWASSTDANDPTPYWQVDLGQTYKIRQVELIPRQDGDQPTTRKDFEVRASNTSDFSNYTVLGAQGGTSFPYLTTWSANVTSTTMYRYLRVVRTGTSQHHFNFSEFRVYGAINTNISNGKTVSASSIFDSNYPATKGNDNNTGTIWASSTDSNDPTPYWQIDLGQSYKLSQVELIPRQDGDQPITRRNFEVRASNTSDFSSYIIIGSQGGTAFPYLSTWAVDISNPNMYRYLRVVRTTGVSDHHFNFSEFKVYKDE